MANQIPKFDSYICAGDNVSWEQDGFTLRAEVEYDEDTRPSDFDCYSKVKINQWHKNYWFFGCIHITATKRDIELSEVYLSGVEINFNKKSNLELNGLIFSHQLDQEVIELAREAIAALNN